MLYFFPIFLSLFPHFALCLKLSVHPSNHLNIIHIYENIVVLLPPIIICLIEKAFDYYCHFNDFVIPRNLILKN